eukprot:CAMPEP_0179291378 /NCGR_PEP_ID=MMETSP0797-20121207/42306_1 /TAXON_ID=47934 /ORGANISM="Dinophysis acuminata, Strain DAEP01" /LENGTH=169 /DNA_ID=CAMNT_0021000451 /DNA_START=18 /DNA_END=524 /DNA_ORIENTATION=-
MAPQLPQVGPHTRTHNIEKPSDFRDKHHCSDVLSLCECDTGNFEVGKCRAEAGHCKALNTVDDHFWSTGRKTLFNIEGDWRHVPAGTNTNWACAPGEQKCYMYNPVPFCELEILPDRKLGLVLNPNDRGRSALAPQPQMYAYACATTRRGETDGCNYDNIVHFSGMYRW